MKFRLRCETLEARDNPSGDGLNPSGGVDAFEMVDPLTGLPVNGSPKPIDDGRGPADPDNPAEPFEMVDPITGQPIRKERPTNFYGDDTSRGDTVYA